MAKYKCSVCGKEWTGVTNRRADRPLNQGAVQEANKEVWDKCKDRLGTDPETGKGRKLNMNSDDYLCRRRWMDTYLAALEPQKKEKPPDDPVDKCPYAATGDLVIAVTDASDEKPIAEADVLIRDSEYWTQNGKTTIDGNAEFPGIKPGSYEIEVSERDYRDVSTMTTVVANKTNVEEVKLTRDFDRLRKRKAKLQGDKKKLQDDIKQLEKENKIHERDIKRGYTTEQYIHFVGTQGMRGGGVDGTLKAGIERQKYIDNVVKKQLRQKKKKIEENRRRIQDIDREIKEIEGA